MAKAPQDTESRHADKYIVRFPEGMRDKLKAAAAGSNRTLNAEIVARLEESMAPRGPGTPDYEMMKTDILLELVDALRESGVIPKKNPPKVDLVQAPAPQPPQRRITIRPHPSTKETK